MDETGLSLNRHSSFVIAERGSGSVFTATSNREHVILTCLASASGYAGKPYFICPRKVPNFLGHNFVGSKVNHSDSGYLNDIIFEDWVEFFIHDIKSTRGDLHCGAS